MLIELADAGDVAAEFSGALNPPAVAHAVVDGAPWAAERGIAGDLRMVYADCVDFHLDVGATRLLCAPADPTGSRWKRALMDSGLTTAALQRGHEALHASACVVDGRAVAITGPSGAGKTTLMLELIARGHPLLTDDILVLSRDGDRITAHPGPPLMNVPAAANPPTRGDVLSELADGAWVEIAGAATQPTELGAIFQLRRSDGETDRIVDVASPSMLLLGAGLDSGSSPERRRGRFDLLSAVAAAVPVRQLFADTTSSPAKLANMIEC